jgi:hypothetical protein
MWPADAPSYEQHIAVARAALGDAAFDAAFAAGEVLTLDQAIAEALASGA